MLVHRITMLCADSKRSHTQWQVYVETFVESETIYHYCNQTNTLEHIQGIKLDKWFKKAALAARLGWSETPLVSG